MRERFIPCFLSPSDDATLCEGEQGEEQPIAIAESTTTAAKARAVSSWALSCRIRMPSPSLAPAHSPKTAPITATATAILAPLKT